MQTTASVATTNASRYLQQLCKHFGHKIETRFDESSGTCLFPTGTVGLAAHDDRLVITVTADDEEALARWREVIWSHLVRFAFREDLAAPDWTAAG